MTPDAVEYSVLSTLDPHTQRWGEAQHHLKELWGVLGSLKKLGFNFELVPAESTTFPTRLPTAPINTMSERERVLEDGGTKPAERSSQHSLGSTPTDPTPRPVPVDAYGKSSFSSEERPMTTGAHGVDPDKLPPAGYSEPAKSSQLLRPSPATSTSLQSSAEPPPPPPQLFN